MRPHNLLLRDYDGQIDRWRRRPFLADLAAVSVEAAIDASYLSTRLRGEDAQSRAGRLSPPLDLSVRLA
jgi:hypothetical protein